MPMNITYREAEPSDSGKFLEYSKRVGGESDNLTFGSEGLPFSISQEAEQIRRYKGNPYSLMRLAFDEGELIGTGVVSIISERERFIHRRELAVSVRKDYWGKGVGTELLKRITEFCKTSGAKTVELEVRSDNERAIALYKKFGFKKVGTNEKFFRFGDEFFPADYMHLYL